VCKSENTKLKIKTMENFDLRKIDKKELEEMVSLGAERKRSTTIFVVCNNIGSILEAALAVSAKSPTYPINPFWKKQAKIKTYNVFYQPNSDFFGKMEIDEICTAEYYEKAFDDYCNYFDKNRFALITRINKTFFNYSKNQEKIVMTDYPEDIKMILIIENFNFWDLNSQSYMAQLSNKNPNIIVIGQIRSDFNFAMNHIDVSVRSGKGGSSIVNLKE
jgi:hypothetical protein